VIGERIYIVDFGQSSARQLTLADPLGRGSRHVMNDIRGFFITHLHSDHTMDLANYALSGFSQGWPRRSVPVIGPWARRIRAMVYPGADIDPDDEIRAPGTREFVEQLLGAYEADSLDRELAGRKSSLRSRMHGVDIIPPHDLDPDSPQAAAVRPWRVYEDECVHVSATIVDHGAMHPALAFRFDTARWSVVFSGDTGPSANLITLAAGADTLVHEVIDSRFAGRMIGSPPYTDAQQEVIAMVLAKHTSVEDVGLIAHKAGVKRLALSHLVPGDLPPEYWQELVTGFEGEVIVGEDLTTLEL
jgi:ribonuclease BN (tRNA processing enzyme)